MGGRVLKQVREFYNDYMEHYRKGVERFGIWWTIFTASILGFALIFIVFAFLLATLFL